MPGYTEMSALDQNMMPNNGFNDVDTSRKEFGEYGSIYTILFMLRMNIVSYIVDKFTFYSRYGIVAISMNVF